MDWAELIREELAAKFRPNTMLPLPEPTKALPGSEDKILEMQRRLERGEQLYHPDDACQRIEDLE